VSNKDLGRAADVLLGSDSEPASVYKQVRRVLERMDTGRVSDLAHAALIELLVRGKFHLEGLLDQSAWWARTQARTQTYFHLESDMGTDRVTNSEQSWLRTMADMETGYDEYPQEKLDGSQTTTDWPYNVAASDRQIGGGHYKKYAIEPSFYILKNNIGWLEGNAIKYLTRWKDKGGRQDLEKAKHYVELLLEWTK
jgi:hypothetical protein